jgi:sulfinoalanine decarboxylase
VTWNPHKLLAAPQQCSTFLIKHKNVLKEGHCSNAKYLFQKDKFYDTTYDTGDKHIQCGRRADVLKFWFMWKAKGSEGFEKHIDTLFDNASFFLEHIRKRDGFQLVLDQPECTNIPFWYIPNCLRGRENEPDFRERLHKVAPKLKERMIKEGSMMVTYQPQGNLVNFFRIVFQSSALDHKDMVYFANEFERLGKDIAV